MPVKCRVKYTIADISETTNVFCSKLMEPTILSISRDMLIQKAGDDGLTFKCEVTFTNVPKSIGIPVQTTQSRSFAGTVTIPVRLQNHRDLYETPEYPIDTDGKLVWSILVGMYKTNKGTQIKTCMRTSAANCSVMLTCVHAASDTRQVRQTPINYADPNRRYCNSAFYPTNKVYDEILEIKCTVTFTFRYLIQPCIAPQERSVAIESMIRRTKSLRWQYYAKGYHKLPSPHSLTPRQVISQYTKPLEDDIVSDNDSDDTSEYTSSEDNDGSDEEDGMTDQERLAYRLQRQNEETLAVQKLLAKTKNVPMIAEGSTF